jgi:hypothetical protein
MTRVAVMPTELYHFTHFRNLPSIFEIGELRCDNAVREAQCLTVEVGNRSIKDRRRALRVPCGPRGVVADYVPLYFAPRSPMLYSIHRGNVPEYPDGQPPLVYLTTNVESLLEAGVATVFTDGNASSALTEFFMDANELPTRIDWDLMQARMWNDTADDGDRMRRRMAEALVHEALPATSIMSIACFDQRHAEHVTELLDTAGFGVEVQIRRDWYY